MALDPADLEQIAALVEARLIAERAAASRRRRRWLWPLLGLAGILVGVATAGAIVAVDKAQDWLAERNAEYTEMKLAYQRELAKNQEWQRVRREAEKAAHYQPQRTQAEHEAALMNQALGLMTEQSKLKDKWAQMDFSDPKAMQEMSADLGKVLNEGLGTIGQVLLRNSDPVHNTREERMRQDGAGVQPAAAAPALKGSTGN